MDVIVGDSTNSSISYSYYIGVDSFNAEVFVVNPTHETILFKLNCGFTV